MCVCPVHFKSNPPGTTSPHATRLALAHELVRYMPCIVSAPGGAPTVADIHLAPCGRCTTADLRDVGIVPQDAKLFADTVPLSRKTVSRLMRRTPRDVGRWVHATKDSCVMAAVARGQLPGPEKKTHGVL